MERSIQRHFVNLEDVENRAIKKCLWIHGILEFREVPISMDSRQRSRSKSDCTNRAFLYPQEDSKIRKSKKVKWSSRSHCQIMKTGSVWSQRTRLVKDIQSNGGKGCDATIGLEINGYVSCFIKLQKEHFSCRFAAPSGLSQVCWICWKWRRVLFWIDRDWSREAVGFRCSSISGTPSPSQVGKWLARDTEGRCEIIDSHHSYHQFGRSWALQSICHRHFESIPDEWTCTSLNHWLFHSQPN